MFPPSAFPMSARAPPFAAAANASLRPSGPPFSVGSMLVALASDTQTVASLSVAAADLPSGRFDFMPDAATCRGSHRLGDVTLRARAAASSDPFVTLSTGGTGSEKAAPLPTPAGELAAADLGAALEAPAALPLSLTRHYARAADGQ